MNTMKHSSSQIEALTGVVRFVATVSHELRTPLTSIRAFSEILRDNPEMERQQRQEFLQIVVKETERLSRLINDVLDLAKIESGHMKCAPVPRDLRDLIRESATSVSQLLTERSAMLEQDLPEQEAVAEVDGD